MEEPLGYVYTHPAQEFLMQTSKGDIILECTLDHQMKPIQEVYLRIKLNMIENSNHISILFKILFENMYFIF